VIGDDGDVDGQLMTVVIGAGGDDVHAVLLFQEDFLPRGHHTSGVLSLRHPPRTVMAWCPPNVLVLLYFDWNFNLVRF